MGPDERRHVRNGMALPRVSLFFFVTAAFFVFSGCDENGNDESEQDGGTKFDPKRRFDEAAVLDADWCIEAQLHVAALRGTEIGADKIDETRLDIESNLSNYKTGVVPAAERPIKIFSYLDKMTNTIEPNAPDSIGKKNLCKCRSHDGIEHGLDIELPGDEGTCREMNERAMQWALDHLSPDEKKRYESEGKKLVCADDIMGEMGGDWYGTPSLFTESNGVYEIASSALFVLYDAHPDVEEGIKGVHYCKLIPPSQMLFWMLHRAFWDDPLGTGPNGEEDVKLGSDDEGCQLTGATSPGSCIFFFATSNQHYCEEYTGSTWDAASAEERCKSRTDAVFATTGCSERTDETKSLDGDGEYKGVCLINCGQEGEYRWHIYSEPDGMTIDQACPDWFPLDG